MGDGRGIDPAGQEAAERHIGHQLPPNRLSDIMPTGFDGRLGRERLHFLGVVGRAKRADHRIARLTAFDEPTREKFPDPGRGCQFARGVEQGEVGDDRARVWGKIHARDDP